MNTTSAEQKFPKLLTVRQCVEQGIYPNHGGLRALIFNAETNGFIKVIRRINKKIFIDVQSFYQWVNAQNGL